MLVKFWRPRLLVLCAGLRFCGGGKRKEVNCRIGRGITRAAKHLIDKPAVRAGPKKLHSQSSSVRTSVYLKHYLLPDFELNTEHNYLHQLNIYRMLLGYDNPILGCSESICCVILFCCNLWEEEGLISYEMIQQATYTMCQDYES